MSNSWTNGIKFVYSYKNVARAFSIGKRVMTAHSKNIQPAVSTEIAMVQSFVRRPRVMMAFFASRVRQVFVALK